MAERVERRDVEAAVEARRELGPEYEPQIVENFLAKIEHAIGQRDDFDIEREMQRAVVRRTAEGHRSITPLALGSIGCGVGATAIATGNHQSWVAVIAWIAIAIVNLGYAFRRR